MKLTTKNLIIVALTTSNNISEYITLEYNFNAYYHDAYMAAISEIASSMMEVQNG